VGVGVGAVAAVGTGVGMFVGTGVTTADVVGVGVMPALASAPPFLLQPVNGTQARDARTPETR
jgi:hypothetical protein